MSDSTIDLSNLSEKKRELFKKLLEEKQKNNITSQTQIIPKRQDKEAPALSFAQQRLWFLEQLEPGSVAYNIPVAVGLSGRLDIAALEYSLNKIVERHESLRTVFDVVDGLPIQVIADELKVALEIVDISNLPKEERSTKVQQFAAEDNQKPYALDKGPLIRATLLKLDEEEHVMVLNMHHIISDGWSMRVFTNEMGALYEAYVTGKNIELPELPIQYADYAIWQRDWMKGEVFQQQLKYWNENLQGGNFVLELPADNQRPPVQSFKGARHYLELSPGLTRDINNLAQQKGVTPFMILLSAFKILLHRYSNQDEIICGTPIAGRNRHELEELIGFFVNMLALRTDMSDNPSVDTLLERVKKATLGAYANQDLPFESLVEELQPERDLSRNPLFQVSFGYQNETMPPIKLPGVTLSMIEFDSMTAKFDLELQLWKADDVITGFFEYSTDLFNADTVARIAEHLKSLLEGIIENQAQLVDNIPMMTEAEKNKLLVEWNDTAADFPKDLCIYEIFEAQVSKTPDAVAVVYNDTKLTYSELNAKANQLAHYLKANGVGPDSFVGICMERSLEMVIAIYGIVKAGAAYVPIDPEYPKERQEFMLGDANVPVLLTQAHILAEIPANSAKVVCLDKDWDAVANHSTDNLTNEITPANLAYMIYTSGSTGKPKGAMNTHRALVNRLNWMQKEYKLDATDCVLQKTPFSFDVSVWEFFWPLLNGARLVMAEAGGHKDSAYLASVIAKENVTTMHFVPSMLQIFVEEKGIEKCSSLRRVICSGEALPYSLQERFFKRLPCVELHNLYGPTEAAIDVTYWQCQKDSELKIVPIGRPIDNIQIYILDKYLQPVPVGVPGELHIGGVGLARGYHNRPELTAEKFIQNPFSNEPSERLYKTGDLCRYLPDGNIEYVGRIDFQVKIRGLRIELGEIETVIAQWSGIKEAVVIVREDVPGDKRIVAYLVAENEGTLDINLLRSYMKEKLPEYMVPQAFVTLGVLPLTPNGKLDRNVLPAPDGTRKGSDADYIAPDSEMEKIISTVWQEVLKVDKVGLNDNFFDLGGHSILLTQVHNKLRTLVEQKLTLIDLFKYPTVGSLANYLDKKTNSTETILQYQEDVKARREAVNRNETEVAIIGIALRFPGSKNPEELWDNLKNGVESISFFTDEEIIANGGNPNTLKDPNYVKADGIVEDVEYFDASFFGYSPREAEMIDPQQRIYMECAWEALEKAGYDSDRFNGRIGCYSAVNMSTYLFNNIYSSNSAVDIMGNFQVRIPYLVGNEKDFLSTRIAYKMNFNGPCMNVQTACSSAAVAVHTACQSLLNRECDMALAGGVTIKVPQKLGYLYQEGGVPSPDGHCRTFDAKAKGAVPGNGVGVVVVKRLADAVRDGDHIYAVIKGSAINNDGGLKVGFTAPSIDGQSKVIADALTTAGVSADTITYVEAHGTATELGDPIEVEALTQVYRAYTDRKGYCGIGSIKTNMGHLDTAAGVAGIIKNALSLKNKMIPPSLHYERPNPNIDFENSPFYVNSKLQEWKSENSPRRAGVSCFGIGGTNVHMIMEEPPEMSGTESRPQHLFVLSAKTDTALNAATANFAAYIKKNPEVNLADAAYTFQVGRKGFKYRRAIVASDHSDLLNVIETPVTSRIVSDHQNAARRPVVFMFPGQGSQYVNMALELYKYEPTFREVLDQCCEILKGITGNDLRDVLYPAAEKAEEAAALINQTVYTQQTLFVVEYATAKLLMEWGIRPEAMIGHSIGEYVAACVAGVLELDDALKLVVSRAKLMQSMPAGAMLSVTLPEEEVKKYLGENLSLATLNAPSICVVAGTFEAIEALEKKLTAEGVNNRRIHTSHAFHSAMMQPIVEEFTALVKSVKLNAPVIPYISNVTGTWIKAEEATDSAYWARHLRGTVRFNDGIQELLKQAGRVLVEVGPGQTLSTLARKNITNNSHPAISTIHHPQETVSDEAFILNALGKMWAMGIEIDWTGFYKNEKRLRVVVPTYPFERKRYWIEQKIGISSAKEQDNLDKKPDIADWFYLPSWKRSVTPFNGEMLEGNACWILFKDQFGIADKVAESLTAEKQNVVEVSKGDAFASLEAKSYTINPANEEDYVKLLKEIKAAGLIPQNIMHLWSVTDDKDVELDTLQTLGFYSLLYLAKALEGEGIETPVKLGAITNNMQKVAGEKILQPVKATILGICRVLPREFKNVDCVAIDITVPEAASSQEDLLVEQLIAETTGKAAEKTVAYRDGDRWAQTYEPVRFPTRLGTAKKLRKDGVYLVTGGLGGVGLEIALSLAETVNARIALVGRSPLPVRSEWKQYIETHEATDPTSGKIRKLQEIEEKSGYEVLVYSADVSNIDQMRNVVNDIYARYGEVNGVIHAAGLPGGGMISLKTKDAIEKVFAPKVTGTIILDTLFKDKKLDFLALCSSRDVVLGGFGLADYCAANAFMDSFAYASRQNNGNYIVSINWDTWMDVGMAANIETPAYMKALEREARPIAILPEEGVQAFSRILFYNMPQVIVSTRELQRVMEQVDNMTKNADTTLDELEAVVAAQPVHERPVLDSVYVKPHTAVEKLLADLWQKYLGVNNIGINDNYFELGGDSVINLQIVSKANEAGIKLTQKQIFENQTIAELAAAAEILPRFAEVAAGKDIETDIEQSSATVVEKNAATDVSLVELDDDELSELMAEFDDFDE